MAVEMGHGEDGRFLPGDAYTPEIGQRICAKMVGGKSLRSICDMEGMPCKQTVMTWLQKHPEFLEIYRIAQQERAEGYFEEIADIADDGSNDWMSNNDPDNPGYKFNGEHFGRSRLRVDTRKWICAKMNPKKYGDKIDVDGSLELKHRLIING
jgi:hypothetical protein